MHRRMRKNPLESIHSIVYRGPWFVKDFSDRHLPEGGPRGYSTCMFKALMPGTFDPPTNGHLNILMRASRMFDALEVVIAVNPSKHFLFSPEERLSMMQELIRPMANVTVSLWDGLIVDFAERSGARVILRGVRAMGDFEYEFELSVMNRSLNPRIETILLPTDQKYSVLRSSVIKDIARLKGNIGSMVPPAVAEALAAKFFPPGGDRT